MSKSSVYEAKTAFEKEFLPTNNPRKTGGWWDEEDSTFYYNDEFLRGAFVCFQQLEARVKAAEDAADKYLHEAKRHQRALLAAEEELARLKAQEPVDFRWRWARDENAVWTYCHMDKYNDAVNAFGDNALYEKVYTKPHPAAAVPEGWEACSPEWIELNGSCSCAEAPRIAFGNTGPHYHPAVFDGGNQKRFVVRDNAFRSGLNALNDCLDDCGDSEQGLRLAIRAIQENDGGEIAE